MLDPKRLSVVFAVAMLPALLAQGPSSDVLVIEGGTLVDGRGGAPVRDALIVVEGNIIKTVTRKGQAAYPSGARVIRADGKFIVPGLMDAHVHYGEWLPELFLAYGVTSIFEIGGGAARRHGAGQDSRSATIRRGREPGRCTHRRARRRHCRRGHAPQPLRGR